MATVLNQCCTQKITNLTKKYWKVFMNTFHRIRIRIKNNIFKNYFLQVLLSGKCNTSREE